MNKNSYPVEKILFRGNWGECPQLNFSNFGIVRNESGYRKLIFGLQVNIDKSNSRRYDVNR